MIIDFEGSKVIVEDEVVDNDRTGRPTDPNRLRPGETYMAWSRGRDKWVLLTCKYVNPTSRVIFPVEEEYPFDTWVCHRVIEIQ